MGKIKLNDQVEADVQYYLSKDAEGNVSATLQKVLVDETTNTSENDGDPYELSPTADEQAEINSALDTVIGKILNDRATAAAAAPAQPATETAPVEETPAVDAPATENTAEGDTAAN